MKICRLLFLTIFISSILFLSSQNAFAQTAKNNNLSNPTLKNIKIEILDNQNQATDSTQTQEATEETKLSSPSAEVEQKIQKIKDEDITETSGKQKSKLAAYIDEHPPGPLSWHNFLQHAIIKSIEKGLSASIIVLLVLFPLIASLIAFSRHVVGLQGFGIYIPAVLSVAFVSTGIVTGVTIFLVVLLAATLTKKIIKKLRLPYLPRNAMILWGVSIVVLVVLIFSSQFNTFILLGINIFPILIIMLLTENFMGSQLFNSQKEATRITLETLFIAISCSLLISQDRIQKFVLLKPELTLIGTAVINFLIGRYSGLRLLEYLRFNPILNTKTFSQNPNDKTREE